jgi:hypothetical protein
MNLVKNIYEIAEDFMKDPSEVTLNDKEIEWIANEMIRQGPTRFPHENIENIYKTVLLELVASSVNYCYWYGKSTIRPNGASSTFLYECIGNAFFDYTYEDHNLFNLCLTRLINLLIINRFSLIEERMYHLNQLRLSAENFARKVMQHQENKHLYNTDDLMKELITLFPGFASDMFLKRTFLFFIQMNRKFGWFEEECKTIPVPADYQVPKMLNHFGCFSYSTSLQKMINLNKQIPKNSIEECEIRSATILTVKKLCELTGWTVSDVDSFFFLRRHEVTTPFHLTITTDY